MENNKMGKNLEKIPEIWLKGLEQLVEGLKEHDEKGFDNPFYDSLRHVVRALKDKGHYDLGHYEDIIWSYKYKHYNK